ncbi:cytochrome p450 71a4 [Phtheirospermum japonicum]|uniref:Cytochrome p450 71a4 n=1 Tax=Phtheirospermum japonicum TaxID=374723 RepID=A0A830CZS8_9LAMI|nr:cytochrome p450 71a4 [Phtheirospermum japonicum]
MSRWRSGTISSTRKNVPPSPRKLPIIGNLHQLGSFPHRSLRSLSNRYGQLMLLYFGSKPVLVASSAEAAREIMKSQDHIFSNRPKLSIPDRLTYGSMDVGFASYGEYWRQVKSICVVQLLSNKRVQSFRRVREEETSAMVDKIKQLGVVNLSKFLISFTNDVVCRVALGRKYSDDEKDHRNFKGFLGEIMELLGTKSIGDYMPWLTWVNRINGLDAKLDRVAKQTDEFLENVIQVHRDGKLKHDTIKALILDMFAAGTDTTSIALEWTIAELIKNPRTMNMLQYEVRQVAANKKDIDEHDLEKLPYLKAVMKESLRLHPPGPLLIPHESTQDTKVMGYDIKAGTQVMINAWAIARDPSLWEEPEEFRPERFLDSSIDLRGLHFELIPFGAGRRGCPGISFAMAVNELALAKLALNFNFALPNGERGEDLDMSETFGINVSKKLPLLVVATSHAC